LNEHRRNTLRSQSRTCPARSSYRRPRRVTSSSWPPTEDNTPQTNDEHRGSEAHIGGNEASMGSTAEGHVCTEEDRSPREESPYSEADECSGSEEVVCARESAVG